MTDLNVDTAQIKRHLDALVVIGATPEEGVTRLSCYSFERSTHQYMAESGVEVSVDGVRNMLGILPGAKRKLVPILTGSHLDTVINGGRYDGVVGGVRGLEALLAIKIAGFIPDHPMGLLVLQGRRAVPVLVSAGWVAK